MAASAEWRSLKEKSRWTSLYRIRTRLRLSNGVTVLRKCRNRSVLNGPKVVSRNDWLYAAAEVRSRTSESTSRSVIPSPPRTPVLMNNETPGPFDPHEVFLAIQE